MRQMLRKNLTSGTALLIAVALFFAVNIISNLSLKSVRFDLTANKLYTLSEGTRNILASLEEPVTLRLYLSQKLVSNFPQIKSYSVRVKELLEEYQRDSNGKIRLRIIDPEPFSEEEDRAVGYGLQGVPVEGGSATFYFGLVGTGSTNTQQVIPFLQPDRGQFLEYDLTKMIYRLSHPKPPVVGLLSTLPMKGGPDSPMAPPSGSKPWVVYQQMTDLFKVRDLKRDITAIPKDVDVLMLVHPKGLSKATLYAIDQYVLRGGRALIFMDPDAEADQAGGASPFASQQPPQHSDLGPLLKSWGVRMVPGVAIGDTNGAKKIRFEKDGRTLIRDYPIWFGVPPEQMDQNDIVTANLDKLTLASAGVLEKIKGAVTKFTPLFWSSDQSMKYKVSRLTVIDPDSLMGDFHPEGSFTVAARITGEVKTAFPDGPPKAEADHKDKTKGNAAKQTAPPPKPLDKSVKPVSLIIVADTDMLQDRFWVHVQNFIGRRIVMPTASNGDFAINALDNLSGSNDLISVRSRGDFSRPFVKIRNLQQQAEQHFQKKEQELRNRLQQTEQQLQELQNQRKDSSGLLMNKQQQQEITRFREEKVKIRKELREVQHHLREDIETLEGWVKFINIGLIPILIGIGGVIAGLYRLKRRNSNAG